MSDSVYDLDPDVRDMCIAFLGANARAGRLLRVTQTLRTHDEQAALYLIGRGPNDTRAIVTHAPPGYSWHEFGRAFDVCQVGSEPYPDSEEFWTAVGDQGEALSLIWGGRWKHPDRPHFEHHGGQTLAQLRSQAKAGGQLA